MNSVESELMRHCRNGDLEAVRKALDSSGLSSVDFTEPFNLSTPLHCAVKSGNLELVELLLTRGARASRRTRGGLLPHDTAGISAELLAALGPRFSWTAAENRLFSASRVGDLPEVRRLVEEGVDVSATEPFNGQSALHVAARGGHLETAAFLLSCGADPRAQKKGGERASDLARKFGHERLAELLEGSLFGAPLTSVMALQRDLCPRLRVPQIVFALVRYLDATRAEWPEGLFRLSATELAEAANARLFQGRGLAPTVEALRRAETVSPITAGNTLKKFLRDIPGALVSHEVLLGLLPVVRQYETDGDFNAAARQARRMLEEGAARPEPLCMQLLVSTCAFLHSAMEKAAVTRMGAENLARVFAPNVFAVPFEEVMKNPGILVSASDVMKFLIELASIIFRDELAATSEFGMVR